tara:strand:- start:535 stop:813 length:279 start_codon:yes stop_codon:yes gene_type:complete
MKIKNYLFTVIAICSIVFTLTSCSKDSDCHECHIAYEGPNGEIEVEIGEFCGTALEDVEAPGYTHTISETIVGNDTVPAGTYNEIHCEEHAH